MIISGYGLTLERIQEADLELLRTKRNSPEVSNFMVHKEEITPEQQKEWFLKIDNPNNNYFMIRVGEAKVGVISGAEIDWNTMITGNGGLFFWDTSYWGTNFPLYAALLLTDFSFLLQFKKTRVRVLRNNSRAISFNQSLGYELIGGQENLELQTYELTEDRYSAATAKFKKILLGKVDASIAFRVNNPDHASSIQFLEVYNSLPSGNKAKLKQLE